jgi:hypothetical protein
LRDSGGDGTASCSIALFSVVRPARRHKGMTMPQIDDSRIVENTTEARAAVTGHNVRYVLLIGTTAVVVLFVIAYFATRW